MNIKNATAVSVIVPVYKVPPCHFSRCLDSLHSQTLNNSEFLILLDGTDNEAESICKKHADLDSRFKIFTGSHSGASATRNCGISKASGEFVTFLDADDWIEANCCKDVYEFAIQNNSEIVIFDYVSEGKRVPTKPYNEKNLEKLSTVQIEELKRQSIRTTSSKFLAATSTCCKFERRDFISRNNISFDISTKINEDRIVAFNIFSNAQKISYISKTFYHYNYLDDSVSNKINQNALPMVLQYLRVLKKQTNNYNALIGTQTLILFFMHWGRSYFCDSNKDSLAGKIHDICEVAYSDWFKELTAEANTSELAPLLRVETFFIRRGIMFPVWAHAIKWKTFSLAKHFFSKRRFDSNEKQV